MRKLQLVVFCIGICAAAPSAGADAQQFFSGGVLFSRTSRGGVSNVGVGVEGSYIHYRRGSTLNDIGAWGLGGFLQLEVIGLERFRLGVGVQGNQAAVGTELGLAFESGDEQYGGTCYVHIGPFLSIGVASVGGRLQIPIAAVSAGPRAPFVGGMTATLKRPVAIFGSRDVSIFAL